MSSILETHLTKCVICGTGSLGVDSSREDNKEEIIVYGRNGNKKFLHREKRCSIRSCRTSYFYGYYKHKGMKIYHQNVLQNEILISSNQTGFEIKYLFEVTLDIALSNSNFESISAKYNNLHITNLPYDVLKKGNISMVRDYQKHIFCMDTWTWVRDIAFQIIT